MATKIKGDKIKEGSIPLSAIDDDFKFRYSSCPGEGHIDTQYIDITNFKVGDKFTINIDSDYTTYYIGLKSIQGDKIKYQEVEINLTPGRTGTYNIPYKGPTVKADIYHDFDECLIMTITSGINTGSECILELYRKDIYKLDDKYIPDTVIKTTPQTLSDTDKNQALANLGIPRILNINNLYIPYEVTIDELSEILGDCVTNEILIQGLWCRTGLGSKYLPTLHQTYSMINGRIILYMAAFGEFRVNQEDYDVELFVAPSIYLRFDEGTNKYHVIVEEY